MARDEELHREVALKEIQERHAHHPESRTRFVLEAEVTGGLEHPGIVPVYGLGAYPDGRPFYAMRFIRGDSLKDAIDRFHRSARGSSRSAPNATSERKTGPRLALQGERLVEFRQLLGRFVSVCQAIAYAHSRGVLHRDIKPANVMLGKFGETLVVDWGLAKPLGVNAFSGDQYDTMPQGMEVPLRPSSSGSAETVAGHAMGTPAYMSPEQAEGRIDLLGPASDVYSLGATLYHLLTGTAPFTGQDVGDILAKVRRGEVTAPRDLDPSLAPGLNAICLKAKALKPEDRYASPKDLADDVEHWLADEPVSAWPEPWTVKTRRWMGRHRALVSSSAAALFVGLIALGAGLLWYQDEQNRQATEASVRAAEKERKRLLAEEGIRIALGQAEKQRQELHDQLNQRGGVFLLLNNPDAWKARIQVATASLDQAQGLLANAEEGESDRLTVQAETLRSHLKQDEADRQLALRLEQIRLDAATMVEGKFDYEGIAKRYRSEFQEAGFPVLTETPETMAKSIQLSSIKQQLVASLDHWALIDYVLLGNDFIAILAVARTAAADAELENRLRQPDLWRSPEALAKMVQDLSPRDLSPQMLFVVGVLLRDPEAAEEWLRRVQALHPSDFWLNFSLGSVLLNRKQTDTVEFLRVAIAVRPKSYAAHLNLGIAFYDQKRLPEAIAACERAIEIDPKFALAYRNLGLVFHEQKKLSQAIAAYEKAIEIDPKFALAYNGLGVALHEQKKLPQAIAALEKAIEIDTRFAWAYTNLGVVLREQKKLPQAIAAYEKAIEIDPEHAMAYFNLGNVLHEQKKLPQAIAAYEKAIQIDPAHAMAYNNLGDVLLQQKKLPEAIAAYEKAIEIDPKYALAHTNMGHVFQVQKNLPQSIAAYEKAIEIDPRYATAYYYLGHALREQKKLPQAIAAYEKAIEIDPRHAMAYTYMGLALHEQRKLPEAIAAYEKAIEIDPKYALAYNCLGVAFREQKTLPQAIAAFRKATELDGQFPNHFLELGSALHGLGEFAEGRYVLQKGVELAPPGHPLRQAFLDALKSCDSMLLEQRLLAHLEHKKQATPEELPELASLCLDYKQRYSVASKLFQEAFQKLPALEEQYLGERRFQAACASVLAGGGQGDGAKLADEEKARHRLQAHSWLSANLDQYARMLPQLGAKRFADLEDALASWPTQERLALVRDPKTLAGLPDEEQKLWKDLWSRVDQLQKQMQDRLRTQQLESELKDAEAPHDWKLAAGRTYLIDLKSPAFNTFLKLRDAAGKQMAENDDISKTNLNSRLVFTAPADGLYRLVVTSYGGTGTGLYTLTVREFLPAAK